MRHYLDTRRPIPLPDFHSFLFSLFGILTYYVAFCTINEIESIHQLCINILLRHKNRFLKRNYT